MLQVQISIASGANASQEFIQLWNIHIGGSEVEPPPCIRRLCIRVAPGVEADLQGNASMRNLNTRRYRNGFTLVEIMIVVLIIGVLLAVAVPQFMKSREGAHARACQHNLKQILGAKERWAMENNRGAADTPGWADLTPFFVRAQPDCPGGGSYTIGSLAQLPICDVGGVRGEWNAHVIP
jgi:prepilin-type N-terminal cleavage/methylation domain-containing protein